MSEHQEFVELCTFYVSGSISGDQLERLDRHLEGCTDCRRALEEFQEVASMGLPSLAPDLAAVPIESGAEAGEVRSQHRLLARIENEITARRSSQGMLAGVRAAKRKATGVTALFQHTQDFLPYAAMVLMASIGAGLYNLGTRRAVNAFEPKLEQAQVRADSLEGQIAKLSRDRKVLNFQLQERDRKIAFLVTEVNSRRAELAAIREEGHQLRDAAEGAEAKRAALDAQRVDLHHQLSEAEAALNAAQKALVSARGERAAAVGQVSELEQRLNEAAEGLKGRDQTIQEQGDLLAYDRDIRDLIGARDLYVAEVNDVDGNARTTTPFGRVFYTRGKSLVFYAYELDKQPGVKRAAAFQAWGRRGPDFAQALPLGILYLDSSANRRWVLRLDDPQTIAKIDAVFVTVEPQGGSHRPTGKPLLFAYLKVEPNHP